MFEISLTEGIGYLAMVIVLLSFLMKNVIKLRVINCIGCTFFIVYGILLNVSIPIILTNSAILCVNLYYLLVKKTV